MSPPHARTPAPVSSSSEGNHGGDGVKESSGKGLDHIVPGPSAGGQQTLDARLGGFFGTRFQRRNVNIAAATAPPASGGQGGAEKVCATGWCFGGKLFRGWWSGDKTTAAPPDAACVPAMSNAQMRKIGGYFLLYYVFNGKRGGKRGGGNNVRVRERDCSVSGGGRGRGEEKRLATGVGAGRVFHPRRSRPYWM